MKQVIVHKSSAVGKTSISSIPKATVVRGKKAEAGQRGKTAEKAVKKLLEGLNEKNFDFAFSRLPDARAAGGRLGAVVCDFLVWYRGSILLEVKETKETKRLSKDKLSQLANLKKIRAASGTPIVLVYHTELDRWRVAGIEFFDFGQPSWDLSDLVLYATAAEALASTGRFPI